MSSLKNKIPCCKPDYFSKPCAVKQLKRRLPITSWLPTITLNTFLYDLAGGLTVGLTAIPQSLAYAQLASMPLENGLYSTSIAGLTYFLLGTAPDVNLGPTSLISLLTGGLVDEIGALVHQLLCFFAGLIMIVFAFLRLEIFLNIFPVTVTTGFTSAAAILIVGSQLKYFFGIQKLPRPFVQLIPEFFRKLNQTNLWDFVAGMLVLTFLLGVQHTMPCIMRSLNKRQQTRCVKVTTTALTVFNTLRAIIAIIVSAGIAYALVEHQSANAVTTTVNLCLENSTNGMQINCTIFDSGKTGKAKGLTLTGPVPRGLPRPEVPPFTGLYVKRTHVDNTTRNDNSTRSTQATDQEWVDFATIMGHINIGILIIPLISTIELLAIGRAMAQRNGYTIDASQEMLACGVAHVIGSFLNTYPFSASITRSALNSQCEVKTQLCSFFTSTLVLIAAATIADTTLPYVPKSCLAAVVIAAALSMIETHMAKMIWRINKIDMLPTGITFVACLLLDIEYGIMVGVVSSLVISALLSMRSIKVKITVRETNLATVTNHNCLLVTMPPGELRYPCADSLKKLSSKTNGHVGPVLIDCSTVRELDFATIISLIQLSKTPSKKGALSASYPLVFVGFEGALLEKFKNAIHTLKIKPPSHRQIYFTPTLLETINIFDQSANNSAVQEEEKQIEMSVEKHAWKPLPPSGMDLISLAVLPTPTPSRVELLPEVQQQPQIASSVSSSFRRNRSL